ncbi:CBL-interacting serine/threonine-protein kinase 7 [Asimina triloba]
MAETAMPSCNKVVLGEYELGHLLGSGTYGKVYLARSLVDGSDVAVKVIDKSKIKNATMESRIVREVTAMRRLRHPNIVHLHHVMATKSKIYLAMDHVCGGDLFSLVSRRGRLPEAVARRYFQQLVAALRFCHAAGVAHRDVKPHNLLVDEEGNAKLSDFGLSALPEQMLRGDGLLQTACGTPAYTAPEVVRRRGYEGAKADAWSCGVLLFFLLAGFLPFDDANLASMYQKIYRREYECPPWFSKRVRRVISRLLDPNPETRISLEGLSQLGWFKKSSYGVITGCSTKNQMSTSCCMGVDDGEIGITMNAFDLISMSSGLDLSGLFEDAKKTVKRFSSTRCANDVREGFRKMGAELGYSVVVKERWVWLRKKELKLCVEILEVGSSVVVGEIKVVGEDGGDEVRNLWGDLKAGIKDLSLVWLNDGA